MGQSLPLHVSLVLAEPEGQTWLTHLHHFSICWFGSKPELAALSTIHNITESWNIPSWKGPRRTLECISWSCTGQPHESHYDPHIFPFNFPYSSFCLFLLSLQLTFPSHCPETALEQWKLLSPSDFTLSLELKGSPRSHSDRFPGEPSWFPAQVLRQQCHHPLLPHTPVPVVGTTSRAARPVSSLEVAFGDLSGLTGLQE